MYRRLVAFALVVTTVAIVSLIIPLGLAARDLVRSQATASIADEARAIADRWEAVWRADGSQDSLVVEQAAHGVAVSVIAPEEIDTRTVPAGSASVVASAARGRPAAIDTGDEAFAAAPAQFEEDIGVVLVTATSDYLQEGLERRLAALSAVSTALLVAAGVAAWQLARVTVRPIRELADTADTLAAGDLGARADASTIPEVDEVAVALNRLAHRVQELLASERAATAELAHQLRTPLTVLTADIDAVDDDTMRKRLTEDALALQRTTDEIITNAARPTREGLLASCDAVEVARSRVEFWRVLADYQGRDLRLDVAPGPLVVRLTADDLATAADILLQNVFVHTPEGTSFTVRVQPVGGTDADPVLLEVADEGPGFGEEPDDRTGTTNLGLSIAERIAQASGGRLTRTRGSDGGAAVRLLLGRPPGR